MENQEKQNKIHLDEYLRDCFVNYFISLKENGQNLSYTRIYMAFFNALGGLDDTYKTAEFVQRTKEDFELIAKHLDKISQDMYKETQRANGISDKHTNLENTYTVKDVARKIGISEQAVRKAIKEERLTALEGGRNGGYLITDKALNEFNNKRKRK